MYGIRDSIKQWQTPPLPADRVAVNSESETEFTDFWFWGGGGGGNHLAPACCC